MTDTRGTFRLKNVRNDILNNEYVPLPSIWTTNGDFGHGHYMPGELVRYNTSNSTSTLTGDSTGARYDDTSGGNPTHTYWAGGGSNTSTISKLVYSTYTYTPSLPATLPVAKNNMGVMAGETSVRFVGGSYPSTGPSSQMQKLDYASDSTYLQPGGIYPQNQDYQLPFNSGGANGYWWGGSHNPTDSRVVKLTFSNDSHSYIPASMMLDANGPTGGGSGYGYIYFGRGKIGDTTNGYTVGGSAGGYPNTSTSLKFTYSNETLSYPATCKYPRTISDGVSFTSSPAIGLHNGGGGYTDTALLTFSTENWATEPSMNNPLGSSPSLNTYYSGFSGTSTKDNMHPGTPGFTKDGPTRWLDNATEPPNSAYGTHGSWTGSIYKFDFASSTASYPFGTISSAITGGGSQRYRAASMSSSSGGYISGGNTYVTPSSAVNTQNKITYSTDVNANLPGSTIPDSRWGHAGFADASQGWYWGGNSGSSGGKSTIFKTVFSTESVSTIPARIAANTYYIDSTSSATAGYTFGGVGAPTSSDKLTFSTETTSFHPGFSPSSIQAYGSSTGTQTAGYVTAGSPGSSIVAKITWATETSANIPSTLSSSRSQTYAVGNTTVGFFGGGSPGGNSRIDSIPYATETIAVVPSWAGVPLYANSYYGTGTGARNKGIPVNLAPTATPTPTKAPGPSFDGALWMGGYKTDGSVVSSGGKIEFSTDTVTELPSTHLTGNRYNLAATASIEAGYYGNAQTTQVVKVTYGTETPSVLPGGLSGGPGSPSPGNDPRRRGCSFGPKTVGYMMQGSTGYSGSLSNFDKIVYSTEVISRLPGSNCPYGTYATAGTSNQTTGYATQGAASSNIGKLPFATESWSNIPGWNAWDAKTFSNTTHGFWVGAKTNGAGSEVYKFNYSNDTGARLPGSDHPNQWNIYGWGSGNSTDGWTSGGGFNQGSSYTTSNFYKMAYSNDTWSTSPSTTSNRKSKNAAAGARQSGIGDAQVSGVTPVII